MEEVRQADLADIPVAVVEAEEEVEAAVVARLAVPLASSANRA